VVGSQEPIKFCWILDQDSIPDLEQAPRMKSLASFWGSWQTWRIWQTDNVICSDFNTAKDLLKRKWQTQCNLYINQNDYNSLGRPIGVKLFSGEFDSDFPKKEQVISMMLVGNMYDIVFLVGFDLDDRDHNDEYEKYLWYSYQTAVKRALISHPDTQWILIDSDKKIGKRFQDLSNLTSDKIENVLDFLESNQL
jgi:hypothetical protein